MVCAGAWRILSTENVRVSPDIQLTYLSRLKVSSAHLIQKGHVRAAWGDDGLLRPLRAASSGQYTVDADTSPAVLVCTCLKTLNEERKLRPDERFVRDLRIIHHTAISAARRILEPRVVSRLETGWRFVLERQRFALSAPGSNAPVIERALQDLKTKK